MISRKVVVISEHGQWSRQWQSAFSLVVQRSRVVASSRERCRLELHPVAIVRLSVATLGCAIRQRGVALRVLQNEQHTSIAQRSHAGSSGPWSSLSSGGRRTFAIFQHPFEERVRCKGSFNYRQFIPPYGLFKLGFLLCPSRAIASARYKKAICIAHRLSVESLIVY